MRKLIMILLSILLVVTLVACSNVPIPPPQGITVNDIDFEKVDGNSLTDAQIKMIEKNKVDKGYSYWQEDKAFYIVIFAGEQPTGGYAFDVKSVEDNEGKTNILVELTPPKDMATRVLTYPYTIIKAEGITDNFNIVDTNGEVYKLIRSDL